MPTDQPGPLATEEAPPTTSPIENELPSYRAISNLAVFSLICGGMASFSFADLTFLLFAILAVVLGVLAHRSIKRTPDVLTGARLANAGIAMGLIFGLTVITYTSLQAYILRREASRFGVDLARVLKEGTLGDVLLYREFPDRRKDQTPADKEKQFESMKSRDRMMVDQKMAPMMNLRKALVPKDAKLHFVGVEGQGVDEGLTGSIYYYAALLYEVEGTSPHQHALALVKGQNKGRRYEWWIDDIRYPYEPKSYQVESKPVDDGHGHGKGGH